MAKTNIRKQIGGSLLTSILSLGRTLAPTLGKTLGLSALSGLIGMNLTNEVLDNIKSMLGSTSPTEEHND